MADDLRTAYRTCPLCEATCGLELTLSGDEVVKVRGDEDDVFSKGFICPKGAAIGELHADPDRVTTPLVRRDGELVEATWDEAFAVIHEKLGPILETGDRDALAVYLGNPNAHNLANMLYLPAFLKALGTKNVFSASTVDQFPKQMASALMFGTGTSVPVPDLDHTDHLVIMGANPLASNGSLLTAPDMRGRLRAIRARGGKVVVVDPRRTRTAELADEHVFIRPGTDAHLLMAICHVLWRDGLVELGSAAEWVTGVEEVEALCADWTPERAAGATGVPADVIERMAAELASARRAAVYGRIGTCTQEFGTLTSWLIDVVNTLTGNLDREGGAMFAKPAAGAKNTSGPPGSGRGSRFGRWTSRVRGLPEVFSELPVAVLAEEIETPGEGQVRALFTLSGNPTRSTPNTERLESAIRSLDLYVALDVYVNETTRWADVVLPAPSPLRRPHYDLALYSFAARNVANYTPPVLPEDPVLPDEWVTLLRLAGVVAGAGPEADVAALDTLVATELARRESGWEGSPLAGSTPEELVAGIGDRRGPERLLDLLLRAGPYDITLADLEAAPHGVDLGPLQPRLPEVLRTASGRVELAPEPVTDDVPRLRAALDRHVNGGMVLIGRRELRSNNSWMHNLPKLAGGPAVRRALLVHPDDATRLGLTDGDDARVRSRAGSVVAPVAVSDEVMPGVVSLPHGWGHAGDGVRLDVAAAEPGPNTNVLTDEQFLDVPSGNAALNGVPVEVEPARVPAAVAAG